ncbi:Abasic site processing protein HMCES [Lamellibrachia satsuma]|nr:Abasic site processing protein HMCES [Lamellibrachia satsuma]
MCGRTACTLQPDDICRACGHMSADGRWTQPAWKAPTGDKQYQPSYNIGPTCYLPVLLAKTHFTEDLTKSSTDVGDCCQGSDGQYSCDWIIRPMRWGLVPSWHTGDPSKVGFNMINARSDTILKKKSFSGPLEKGRRCVILVEGYFEWQKSKGGKKQPYFIYAPCGEDKETSQTEGINMSVSEQHTQDVETERGKQGKEKTTQQCKKREQLVRMAGLFDVSSQDKSEEGPLYSFSVITVDAHKKLSCVHDRMPAILSGEAELREWLDVGKIPLKKAICLLRPVDCVDFHPVSTVVNSVRNNTSECVEPIVLGKPKETGSSKFMNAWLSQNKQSPQSDSCQKRTSSTGEETTGKKQKTTQTRSVE